MATSASTDYTLDRDSIIEEALQIVNVVGVGDSPTAAQLADHSRTLNLIVKSWMAEGLLLWTIDRLVVFLVPDQKYYTFGASGDRVCKYTDFVKTELNGAHTATASLIVDSTTGMTAGDVIGVELTDKTMHWTTIVSVDSATTLTLTAALASAAADNNHVYTYTTAVLEKPLRIQEAYLRQDGDSDIPVETISRNEYMTLTDKSGAGRINQIYYDPRVDTGELWVWQVPDGSYLKETLVVTSQSLIEDFDAAGNTPDFPIEWARALVWTLAADLGYINGVETNRLKLIEQKAASLKQQVSSFDVELESLFIVPDFDGAR